MIEREGVVSSETPDTTQDGKPRKPGLTLLEALVALLILGTVATVVASRIIRRQRQAALELARTDIWDASQERVIELVSAFAQLANEEDEFGSTLLHVAARYGYGELTKLLLAEGAKVSAMDEDNETPLQFAALLGHKDVAELLLAGGADVNARNKYGGTPLHRAAREGHRDVVELLLAQGADANAKHKTGLTPLHWAVVRGHEDVVELLIANGADANANGPVGPSLHIAVLCSYKNVVKFLLAHGADVNARDSFGMTPLCVALENSREDVVDLLEKHGARQ